MTTIKGEPAMQHAGRRMPFVVGAAMLLMAGLSQAQSAQSGSGLQFSAGIKLWPAEWDSWVTSPRGTGVALGTSRYQTVQAVGSSSRWSTIPFATVATQDYFASLSAMTRTNYSLQDAGTPGGFEVAASRREFDLNGGYYILPDLAVTLGYKRLVQTYGGDEYKWTGPIAGLSARAPLTSGMALFANASIGRMQAHFPAAQTDIQGNRSFAAQYRLGELGLVYFPTWQTRWPKTLLITFGYRAQHVTTRRYALAVTSDQGVSSFNTHADLKDVTQGFVLGVAGGF